MLARAAAAGALVAMMAGAVHAQTRTRAVASSDDLGETSRSLQALAARVGPSVVEIITLGYGSDDVADVERGMLVAPSRSGGSGVIVGTDGHIVTNAHVVEGAHQIQVELLIDRPALPGEHRSTVRPHPRLVPARVIAIDEETDLAVIKVDEEGLPALEFADSDEVRPGQLVLAFGSPMGLNSSVTLGVVSAVARQLEADDPMIYIQTDAPINPGNSGGPLVDTNGHIVGINTLILSQSGGNEGLGFAAPSNIVRNVFEQIRRYKRVRRGEIGVRTQTITPLLAEGMRLSRDSGVILSDVYPDSPAARAGAHIGDIVVSLDGKPMENGRQLQVNLYGRAVGDSVRLEVERGEQTLTLLVPVTEREDDPTRFVPLLTADEPLIARLGILGLTLNSKAASLLQDLRESTGVVVASTTGVGLPGSDVRLKPGDLIHALNGAPIKTVEELRSGVDQLKPGEAAVLQVEREGEFLYVAVRIDR
jgi:serine protease Do